MNGREMDHEGDLVTIKTLKTKGDLQIIHGYGDGSFRISGTKFPGSVFVTPRHTQLWTPPSLETLSVNDLLMLLSTDDFPPLLLLGVGAELSQPLLALAEDLKNQDIALEMMSTAAACRTWNVLISEGRNAMAALYAVT